MPFIYIISSANTALHKIGFSEEPCIRVDALSRQPLGGVPVAIYYGTMADEKELHKMFKSKQKTGEWFSLCASDLEKIRIYFSDYEQQARKLSELCASLIDVKLSSSGRVVADHRINHKRSVPSGVTLTETELRACKIYGLSTKTLRLIKFESSKNPGINASVLSSITGYSESLASKALACLRDR